MCFRHHVTEVHSKSDTIIKNQVHQPTAQVQPLGYDQISIMNEIRDMLNTMKRDSASKPSYVQQIACPSCATNTFIIVIATVQSLVFIIYFVYK